jgi:hypothetical protein
MHPRVCVFESNSLICGRQIHELQQEAIEASAKSGCSGCANIPNCFGSLERKHQPPISDKVGLILLSSHLRRAFSQVLSKVEFSTVVDREQIFIANLSKGKLGETSSYLLWVLLVSAFEQAAWGVTKQGSPHRSICIATSSTITRRMHSLRHCLTRENMAFTASLRTNT